MRKIQKHTIWLFALPSFVGMLAFYFIPFVLSFYYSIVDNAVLNNFVGFKNYLDTPNSVAFRQAASNTVLFTAICVPLNMVISYLFASILKSVRKGVPILALIFMLPLVIPSGAVVYFWKTVFSANGLINNLLCLVGTYPVNFMQSSLSIGVVMFMFLWKNVGFNMVLFWVGLSRIPPEYYEYAALEGAGRISTFTLVTVPYLSPTTFLVMLMTFINSFKVFREIYLLFGEYPPQYIYMLQHYMNNQFMAANLSKLTSASYIISFVFIIIMLALFKTQKKLSDSY